jgi:hypothetical protein
METEDTKPSNQLTGLCGEHYVSALLAGYGLVVALPRGGAARSDLFVGDSERGPAIRVQVKSGRQSYWKYKRKYEGQAGYSWDTSRSIIDTHDKSLWYAFVYLGKWPLDATAPVVFFVPSEFVASRLKEDAGEKRPFFWGYKAVLEPYCGDAGVKLLKEAIAKTCQTPSPPT